MTGKDQQILDAQLVQKALDEIAQLLMAQLPLLKQIGTEIIDLVFVPKVIGKQLVLFFALETGILTVKQLTLMLQSLLSNFSSRSRLIRKLQLEQQEAATQDEWMDLAERIDQIQGNDVWRSDPNCQLYERERISARIDEFVHLIRRRDIFELMFVLRGSIGRNKFGLLHEGLFTKALAGSKVLVETYHNVICAALDFVCDAPVLPGEDPIPTEARLAFFNETRHAYGRTALLLSGGAALGFYHVGVVRTLMDNRLMPRVIGGASAGSLVCAMIGTRTDEECQNDMFHVLGTDAPGHSGDMRLDFFRPMKVERPSNGLARKKSTNPFMEVYYNTAGAFHDAKLTLQGFVPIPLRRATSLLYDLLTGFRRPQDLFKNDTAHFREVVRTNVGNFTFQEAFDRTGRILNIVVTPNNSTDPPRLLNYLTAPHVLVWSAAVASSSLPGVFEANRLVVKEADGWERYESGSSGQVFSDGSMEQDLPMQQLSEMFNVNHFIVSQANPHAVMLASYNNRNNVWSNPLTGVLGTVVNFLRDQIRSWIINMITCVGSRRIAPLFETQRGMGATFFTQEYEGRSIDISLIPWLGHRGLLSAILHIIYNPSQAEFRQWIDSASRETWRHIPAIKSHIAEEVTLDRCVQRLRKRMLHEKWDKQQEIIHNEEQEEAKIGRVPSFFTSQRNDKELADLVKMGGQSITDPVKLNSSPRPKSPASPRVTEPVPAVVPSLDHNSGWGGMGLRGNRSSGNLARSSSDASGLFIEDEDQNATRQQNAGEDTAVPAKVVAKKASSTSLRESENSESGYLKTSTMANFYYRKNPSFGDLAPARTTSDQAIDSSKSNGGTGHHRRRSKSHADLEETQNKGL